MAAIHSASTKPELRLRRALWRLGFRYRTNDKRLPGKPDIVLPKYHTVIFVHGCFWHGHKNCSKYTIPKTNTDFWITKIARNQERDQEAWRELEAKGWYVIIIWECQLQNAMLLETISRIQSEIILNGEHHNTAKCERKQLKEKYRHVFKRQNETQARNMLELRKNRPKPYSKGVI